MAKAKSGENNESEATPKVEIIPVDGVIEETSEEKAPEEAVVEDAEEATEPEGDPANEGDAEMPVALEEPKDEAEEAASSVEEPAAPMAASPAPEKRGGGFGAMLLGGVCAAAIGAGAVLFALPNLPPQLAGLLPQQGAEAQAEIAALKSALEAQDGKLAELTAALEATKADAAQAEGGQAQIAALADRLASLEARPVAEGGVPDAALSGLQAEIEALRGRIDQVASEKPDTSAALEAVQAQAEAMRAEAEAAARKTKAQAGLTRLVAAFDAGQPLGPILDDLSAQGVSVPTELHGEIPAMGAVQAAFAEAAREALRAVRIADSGDTITGKIGSYLLAQTGARSLEAKDGDGPDAILSRAQAAVDAGDLATALAEIGALPEAGQAPMAGWAVLAQRRIDASTALAALAETLN
ncbi:COG4223 family protein [Pseudothioclava arenosa]|uniref:Mitochondrial inner membrane protein n=1 Tax=Pseudothioclava arenosa TaxID=1795308 RepID=A0A2A4CRB0_9RHOB|nr:hypothetical protein [Pseudothioclava arenosa]PCD76634.1 hypothetical protein CLN94_08550 [Pseudothioclava arenosa]